MKTITHAITIILYLQFIRVYSTSESKKEIKDDVEQVKKVFGMFSADIRSTKYFAFDFLPAVNWQKKNI